MINDGDRGPGDLLRSLYASFYIHVANLTRLGMKLMGHCMEEVVMVALTNQIPSTKVASLP